MIVISMLLTAMSSFAASATQILNSIKRLEIKGFRASQKFWGFPENFWGAI